MELIEIYVQLHGTMTPAAAKLLSDHAEQVDANVVAKLNELVGRGEVRLTHAELAIGDKTGGTPHVDQLEQSVKHDATVSNS